MAQIQMACNTSGLQGSKRPKASALGVRLGQGMRLEQGVQPNRMRGAY